MQSGRSGSRKRLCICNRGHPVIEHLTVIHSVAGGARRTYSLQDVHLLHSDFRAIPLAEPDSEANQVEVYVTVNGAVRKADHPMTADWKPFAAYIDAWIHLCTDSMTWTLSLDAKAVQDRGRLVEI